MTAAEREARRREWVVAAGVDPDTRLGRNMAGMLCRARADVRRMARWYGYPVKPGVTEACKRCGQVFPAREFSTARSGRTLGRPAQRCRRCRV